MNLNYKSPIRKGVLDIQTRSITDDFSVWARSLIGNWEFVYHELGNIDEIPIEIAFEHSSDQAAYLLTYTEPVDILLNMLRRVMPKIIASEICGVAPMVGPSAQIFNLRNKFNNCK